MRKIYRQKMRVYCVLFLPFILFGCHNEDKTALIGGENRTSEQVMTRTTSEYYVLTVENPGIGWGYQIFKDGKLAIDQKHIPVIQGYKGFSTKENAEKVGNYIIDKMTKGIFPPTLTKEELDSLKVLID